MIRRFLTWLLTASEVAYVQPWHAGIADRHAANTERLLLGACGPARPSPTAAQRARQREERCNAE